MFVLALALALVQPSLHYLLRWALRHDYVFPCTRRGSISSCHGVAGCTSGGTSRDTRTRASTGTSTVGRRSRGSSFALEREVDLVRKSLHRTAGQCGQRVAKERQLQAALLSV